MAKKEDEITLVDVYLKFRDTIRFLWSKKLSIIVVGLIGGSIGLTYAFLNPVKYESKLTFIVEQSAVPKGLGALSGLASSFGLGGIGGEGGLYDNQANLMNYLKSRSIIESAYLTTIPGSNTTFAEQFISSYEMDEDWHEDSLLNSMRFSAEKPRESFSIQEDSILFDIYNQTIEDDLLEVSIPDNEGSILAISFKSIDDTLARFLPETLLSIVSENYVKTKTKNARENVDLLQHQTDSIKVALKESLLRAATSNDQVFGLNPALNVKRVPATKEQIDIQASTIMLEELIKNLELAKVQLKDKTPLIETIDAPRFPLEIIETSKILATLVLGFVFGFFWVLFLLLRKSIAVLEAK